MNGDQEAEVSSADATLLQRFFVAGAPLQPYICIETLKTERYEKVFGNSFIPDLDRNGCGRERAYGRRFHYGHHK